MEWLIHFHSYKFIFEVSLMYFQCFCQVHKQYGFSKTCNSSSDTYLWMCYRRKWVGGEVVQAVAYDIPIPGYKTKNTISLRLWDAKASAEDFNLFQFNDGQYESAAQLHSRAQQVSYQESLEWIWSNENLPIYEIAYFA